MEYEEIYNTYKELKDVLVQKKEAIKTRNIEQLHSSDEEAIVLCQKIQRISSEKQEFSTPQKESLKKLIEEIKEIEENNEILIKHSLDVINGMLSGILNIAQGEKCSYDSKGLGHCDKESLEISSITEEA